MNGFADANEANEVMKAVVGQMDHRSLQALQIVYSYRLTDIDWSFTFVIEGGKTQMFEGILPESETTIETTSSVLDSVLTGAMTVATAHFTDQARIRGSVGNILKLRAIVPVLSEAYRAVKEARMSAPRARDA